MKLYLFSFLVMFSLWQVSCKCDSAESTYIYLVRHADKGGKDSLSMEGITRADQLKHMLSKTGIDMVFSTNYNRTKDTAKPLAEALNLEVEMYNPKDLEAFSVQLKENYPGKRILVVGHSNTTPTLTNFLMGNEHLKQIDEKEYDNLYLVVSNTCCASTLLEMEFGAESPFAP